MVQIGIAIVGGGCFGQSVERPISTPPATNGGFRVGCGVGKGGRMTRGLLGRGEDG
jgi:hypothetical protein